MAYKFVCSNNPEHLFEEPTFDYWCDKCPIEQRSMLVSYTEDPKTTAPSNVEKSAQDAKAESEKKDLLPQDDNKKDEKKKIERSDDGKSKIQKDTSVKIPVISIGKQSWMTMNLSTDTFLNGDKIFQAATEKEWMNAGAKKSPAWCYPANNELLGKKYGKLYNWFAVSDPRGICPPGMKIPGKADIENLLDHLDISGHSGVHLKASGQWKGDDNGQDLYHMNVLPYPKRYAMGSFAPDGFTSAFWTADEYVYYTAHYWELRASDNLVKMGNMDKNAGFLIRCIKK